MKNTIRWMAHNDVAANLLMMVFIIGGLVMAFTIKQEVFPEISLDVIRISVEYPGAGPEDVEEGIILKIEENITGVDGIKEIKAVASEGFGTVNVELMPGEDADRVLQDIKTEVDRITTFPKDAEKPVITKILARYGVISVAVYGDVSERALREHAENIRDELLENSTITQVDLGAVRPYEISIEIPEKNLRQYNLTLDQVAERVRRASLDLPGGKIKTEAGEILIRTKERRYLGHEYEEIIIITSPDGTEVKLGDIAQVRDTFRETDLFARFDGMPAVTVEVFRVGNQKPIEISEIVKNYVEKKRYDLPESVHIASYSDMSELYKSRRNLLLKNGFIGLFLVFLILSLFLRIRLALWIMLGIPISFLGAILFMPWLDVSINMMSLFAFVMALGIVVDDAIIVGENIFEHRQKGKPFLKAAVDGALEVGRPVTFAVLTSVAAFMPLLFVTGLVGKFIKAIPLVVISVLIISLIESLLILPAHLSFGRPSRGKRGSRRVFEKVREGFADVLERVIKGPFSRLLELCLRNRYATLAFGISTILITAGLIVGGVIKFNFMPEVEGNEIIVNLEMPRGTPVEETARVHDHIVRTAQEIVIEYDRERPGGESVMRHIFSMIGGTIAEAGAVGEEAGSGSHLANIVLFLTPSEQRDVSSSEMNQQWRKRVGEVPGVDSLTFRANIIHLGADIDILISHEDFDVLEKASEKTKEALNQYPGVRDIADTYTKGNRELKIRLKPEARTLGITEEDLGRQLRGAFYGSEALRLQRERNEVKVMVRYPEGDRKSLWDLESMRIRTHNAGEVPLLTAAYVNEGKGYSEINRTDQKRVVNVTATVDSNQANSEEIIENLKRTVLADLVASYPGLTYELEGEAKETRESFGSMKIGFVMALLVIYALLAIPFRSYSQPLLIMAAIPFGMVGAIMGHVIMDVIRGNFDLSILSVFGMVALAGVVVNDSLLLIDYANHRRKEGADLFDAIAQACRRRFRPILLTSLTTFFGLTPMILETSVQAQFLIPMAVSLAFGVLFATGITLLFIPSIYIILEDIRALLKLKPSHANHRTLDELSD